MRCIISRLISSIFFFENSRAKTVAFIPIPPGQTLRVGYVGVMPYIGLSTDNVLVGRFVDDMTILARSLNATFDFIPSFDGKYGAIDEEGEWNGLIRVS